MTLPSFRLDEQTALVTGAASGIGRGIALGLAAAGANVACFDLPESALDEVCGEIREAGRGAIAVPGDVMDADMLVDAVRDAESEFGPLILAVNSAGIANAAPAEEMSLSQWQRVIDINVTGLFLSCQAESRAMLGHGRGAIVKHRVDVSRWNAHRGIRVNSISPGYTATPMNLRPEVAEQVTKFVADTPLGRMATVDELVGPAIFLLSDAASFCTGVDLLVDGGFTCW